MSNEAVEIDDNPQTGSRQRGKRRTKAGRLCTEVTVEELQQHFHLSIELAAHNMRVGVTALKRLCRTLGVPRWPYRRFQRSVRLLSSLQAGLASPEDCDTLIGFVRELGVPLSCVLWQQLTDDQMVLIREIYRVMDNYNTEDLIAFARKYAATHPPKPFIRHDSGNEQRSCSNQGSSMRQAHSGGEAANQKPREVNSKQNLRPTESINGMKSHLTSAQHSFQHSRPQGHMTTQGANLPSHLPKGPMPMGRAANTAMQRPRSEAEAHQSGAQQAAHMLPDVHAGPRPVNPSWQATPEAAAPTIAWGPAARATPVQQFPGPREMATDPFTKLRAANPFLVQALSQDPRGAMVAQRGGPWPGPRPGAMAAPSGHVALKQESHSTESCQTGGYPALLQPLYNAVQQHQQHQQQQPTAGLGQQKLLQHHPHQPHPEGGPGGNELLLHPFLAAALKQGSLPGATQAMTSASHQAAEIQQPQIAGDSLPEFIHNVLKQASLNMDAMASPLMHDVPDLRGLSFGQPSLDKPNPLQQNSLLHLLGIQAFTAVQPQGGPGNNTQRETRLPGASAAGDAAASVQQLDNFSLSSASLGLWNMLAGLGAVDAGPQSKTMVARSDPEGDQPAGLLSDFVTQNSLTSEPSSWQLPGGFTQGGQPSIGDQNSESLANFMQWCKR